MLRNKKGLLICAMLFAASAVSFSSKQNNYKNVSADSSDGGAYHVVASAYWWVFKPNNVYTCEFSVKESIDATETYVSSTKNDFGTDKSDYSNYLCDFYTNTVPGYYSFRVVTNKKISRTLGFIFKVYYKDELVFYNAPLYEDVGESFGFTVATAEHTFSGTPNKENTQFEYVIDNSNTSNSDELLDKFDLIKNKILPDISSESFVQPNGELKTIARTPASSLEGVSFAGYFGTDSQNNEYEMYYDDNCLPVKTSNLNANTTIKAMFKNNVTFNTNGGEFAAPVDNVEKMLVNHGCYLVGEEMKLPTPVRKNYSFIGWTGTGYDAPTINATIPAEAAGELSYTANWIANNCVVTFTTGEGGSEVPQQSVEFGGYITKPENPTRTLDGIRYEFVEWVYDDQGTKIPFDFTTPVFESLTLEATWVSYIDAYVRDYMHPEILPSDKGTGECSTQGWYLNAKIAFNLLTDEERAAFLSQTEYKPYADRLLAWAAANGDTIIGQILVGSASLPNEVINNDSLIIISIIVCSLACTFISVIIVIRRKQHIKK